MKRNQKGFTLAELLIVIAIIAVLVAIMIPVFGAQLNKARAAVDLANVRSAYSEQVADGMMAGAMTADGMLFVDIAKLEAATAAVNGGFGGTVVFDASAHEVTVTTNNIPGKFKVSENVVIGTPAP